VVRHLDRSDNEQAIDRVFLRRIGNPYGADVSYI